MKYPNQRDSSGMIRYSLLWIVVCAITSGCAPKAVPPLDFTPGAVVESVQSEVSLSYSSPSGNSSGRGYLVFRKPDRSHLVVLSPFGTIVMEAFTADDQLTVTIPSQEVAYVGTFDEIPVKGGLQAWKAMRWIVEGEPAGSGEPNGETVRMNREGKRETVRYDTTGLMVWKMTEDGSEVVYRDYRVYEGVPFPTTIEYRDRRSTFLKIRFEEPEINRIVEESALRPKLDGLTILSIRRFGANR